MLLGFVNTILQSFVNWLPNTNRKATGICQIGTDLTFWKPLEGRLRKSTFQFMWISSMFTFITYYVVHVLDIMQSCDYVTPVRWWEELPFDCNENNTGCIFSENSVTGTHYVGVDIFHLFPKFHCEIWIGTANLNPNCIWWTLVCGKVRLNCWR